MGSVNKQNSQDEDSAPGQQPKRARTTDGKFMKAERTEEEIRQIRKDQNRRYYLANKEKLQQLRTAVRARKQKERLEVRQQRMQQQQTQQQQADTMQQQPVPQIDIFLFESPENVQLLTTSVETQTTIPTNSVGCQTNEDETTTSRSVGCQVNIPNLTDLSISSREEGTPGTQAKIPTRSTDCQTNNHESAALTVESTEPNQTVNNLGPAAEYLETPQEIQARFGQGGRIAGEDTLLYPEIASGEKCSQCGEKFRFERGRSLPNVDRRGFAWWKCSACLDLIMEACMSESELTSLPQPLCDGCALRFSQGMGFKQGETPKEDKKRPPRPKRH